MAHSIAGFLGVTRQVPSCIVGAGQPAHRAAPHPHPAQRNCQHSQSRTHRRQDALNAWVLHAVRADQQGPKVDNSTLQLISDLTNKVDQEHAAILAENAQGLEGVVDTSSDGLKQKVQQSIQKLQKGLLERETEVRSRRWHFAVRTKHQQKPLLKSFAVMLTLTWAHPKPHTP